MLGVGCWMLNKIAGCQGVYAPATEGTYDASNVLAVDHRGNYDSVIEALGTFW
jgi:hypothetical protein